jgi:two-component system CheB/CheR fusion protein
VAKVKNSPATLTKKTDLKKEYFPIVGIGASAGGLEAFTQLLSEIPTDTGMSFVLVQHLDPTHVSMSAEIIQKSIKIPIEEAKDGLAVKPNQVYIIPPNYNMELQEGALKLSLRESHSPINVSIDFLMKSLALSLKNKAIGVLLSGSGADGSIGLGNIKAEGGITFAQTPSSAKYPDLPQNAIDAGVVDFVLTPDLISQELIRIASSLLKSPKISK